MIQDDRSQRPQAQQDLQHATIPQFTWSIRKYPTDVARDPTMALDLNIDEILEVKSDGRQIYLPIFRTGRGLTRSFDTGLPRDAAHSLVSRQTHKGSSWQRTNDLYVSAQHRRQAQPRFQGSDTVPSLASLNHQRTSAGARGLALLMFWMKDAPRARPGLERDHPAFGRRGVGSVDHALHFQAALARQHGRTAVDALNKVVD